MAKISFEDWVNTMSFVIDDNFDTTFLQSITPFTRFINSSCNQFTTPATLATFLTSNEQYDEVLRLKAFVSLIGLSEERLKRVSSLIRSNIFHEQFGTEWDVKRISKEICRNQQFRDLIIDFFINGRNSQTGVFFPIYYMRNFKLLDPSFIQDISTYNYVERILNDNEIQGKYSNSVGEHVERRLITNRIDELNRTHGLTITYESQREFPLLNKNIDVIIPSVNNPSILIEASYNITTGSGQSKRADQLVEFYTSIMRHNANHRTRQIQMINFCDGYGWVGRQRDLRRIYDASDIVLNQNNLNLLDALLIQQYS